MTVSKSRFNCEKCKDAGFTIHTNEDGYEYAVECECHIKKTTEQQLKNSGITYNEYASKSLDTFLPDTDMAKKMKQTAIDFIADKNATGCGFFGKSGTGKTHICIAICQELTRQRRMLHRYFSYRSEIQKLKASCYNLETYDELMYKWTNCSILYIDDFLKFAANKEGIQNQDLQIMFDIINARLINKKITIFSSEMTVGEIKGIDEALGSRIYAIVNPYGIKCDGENRRFK